MRSEFRFRQVHLDFHTSEHIEDVGADFDKSQFVAALQEGNVDSITCFARGHHGWAYYPSKVCQPHPHLKRNLLGEMVEACRENDINIPIYISVQWDERMARERPEWRTVQFHQPEGSSLRQLEATWHTLCLSNAEYVDYLIANAIEVMQMFSPDGLFFDILLDWGCVCRNCLERMQRVGRNPESAADRAANDRDLILEFYAKCTSEIRRHDKDIRIFYNSGHVHKNERERWQYFTHLELESLPTGGWGYDHFPVSARYSNTLGLEYLGMTGKFHTSWGEFGGFKRPVALEYECAQMVAMGARCSIGDQLHPRGMMDIATYRSIGPAYARVRDVEGYCKNARPVSEIAIFSAEGHHHSRGKNEEIDGGCARMLLESQMMFDVIDETEDMGKYKLLILPDTITLEGYLLEKINHFIAGGGAVIMSGTSGMNPGLDGFALDFNADVKGVSEFCPDYIEVLTELDSDLVESPFVVYERAMRVKSRSDAEVLAAIRLPYFNRTWRHFCSHQHSPFRPERCQDYDAVIRDGNIIYFSHPLFKAYYNSGQPLLKYLFRGAVNVLLPEREAVVRMPSSGRMSFMRQDEEKRTILHLLFCQTQLRGANSFTWQGQRPIEIIEDAVPISDVYCEIRRSEPPARVYLGASGRDLEFSFNNGIVRFRLDELYIHEAVVIDD